VPDSPKRILVVDDDEPIRVLLHRVLRREGFAVETASDGFEAITKLSRGDYDTILLDLRMPRVDGFGVLGFLEENRPDLAGAVVIMTANLPGAAGVQAEGRVSRVLPKPFDLGEVLATVRDPN